MKKIKCDRILLPDGEFDGYLYIEGEKIVAITERDIPTGESYDLTGHYLAAGFIDIHTHGGGGYAFEKGVEDVIAAANFHLAHGTTAICPTISAAPIKSMVGSVAAIKAAMGDERLKGTVLGAHLEGPYLSRKQCGAQCADFIEPPVAQDYEPILREYGDVIVRWSYAPEHDGGERFAKALRAHGIVAAAGHTDAVYADMVRAMAAGCSLVTHLYSCTSTVTREQGFRRLGVIETAFLSDELAVEIICDGKHLPPELVRMIYKIKGADKVALVTDSLSLAGTKEKHGFMQSTEFIIEEGVCRMPDRSAFVGSIATADILLHVAVKEAGIPLRDAVKMLTSTPADIMGLKDKGRIACGMDADLVSFDDALSVKAVFARGSAVRIEA